MGDLYSLLRDGSFLVRTQAALGGEPAVTVAATLFCRDGSALRLVRRPPAEQGTSGPFAEALAGHGAEVASRLNRLSIKLALLRNGIFWLALLVGAGLSVKSGAEQVQEAVNGVRLWSFVLPLVSLLAPAAAGAALQGLARAGLRAWLERQLAGGGEGRLARSPQPFTGRAGPSGGGETR